MSTSEGEFGSSSEIVNQSSTHVWGTQAELLSKLIHQDLDLMSGTDVTSDRVKLGVDDLFSQISEARKELVMLEASVSVAGNQKKLETGLQGLNKKVRQLKSKFPFNVIKIPEKPNVHLNWRDRSTPHSITAPDELMRSLASNPAYKNTHKFQDLKSSVLGLKNKLKTCLMCFLIFPKNVIIKKSLMVYWAKVREIGYLSEPINDLIENGIIEPVYKKTFTVAGYWMHPSIHSTLTNQKWLHVSRPTDWMCMVDTTTEEDIIYDDPVLFLEMKELRFLHLGNWQRLSVRHIEVVDPDLFFKDMAELSMLRYVSFRGISLITEVPRFISKLKKLEILDLRACHNLEMIPSDIDNIWESLTHLDMSECYFLEHMPKALSRLRNLRVLKGFFIGEDNKEKSCTLLDLLSLTSLTRFNIYTSVKGFPDDKQLATLKQFKSLRCLRISWGGCSQTDHSIRRHEQVEEQPSTNRILSREDSTVANEEFSFRLVKLDLQCVPKTVTRDWLRPTNFKDLKNLYIRGGKFYDLGQQGGNHAEENQWSVEILHLKHLSDLEMDYSELVGLFPKLICLENINCPKLKHFPCGDGVWKDKTQRPPTTYL